MSAARHFEAGQTFELAGIKFRVERGRKATMTGDPDLRLDWLTADGWQPAPMAAGFLLADFFYMNEEARHPQSEGFKGGNYYLDACRSATRVGWESAGRAVLAQPRSLFDTDTENAVAGGAS